MTVKQLKECLKCFPPDAHVVVSVVPVTVMTIHEEGIRLEMRDTWLDSHGALNIIAVQPCSNLDPQLKKENGL